MTESRSHLAGTTPFQNRIPVRLLAPQHVKGRLGQMARPCHEPLARGMNATHLRIISCPREGGEMTGYNPDQQPKCRLTESAFRDDKRCCPEGQRYIVFVAPGFSPARPLSACRP